MNLRYRLPSKVYYPYHCRRKVFRSGPRASSCYEPFPSFPLLVGELRNMKIMRGTLRENEILRAETVKGSPAATR